MRICPNLLTLAYDRLTAGNLRGDLSPSDAAAIISADALSRLADAFDKLEAEREQEISFPFDPSAISDTEDTVTDADVDAAMSEEKIELAEPESEKEPERVGESASVSLGVDDEAPEEPKVAEDEIIVPAPTRKSRTAL